MMMNLRGSLMGALCAWALVNGMMASASAQLVFGSTTTATTNPSAIYLDVTTGQTTTLWNSAANKKVNGVASDEAGGRLYSNDAARLNFWDYGNIGTVPTFIAGMYRSNGTTTTATGFDGLAWANGALYGSTSFASSTFTRGIYQIPLTPNASNQLITSQVWSDPDPTGTLVLGGLDFNPVDNLFYATQTTDSTGSGGFLTPGIFTIDVFGSGAFTRIADLPPGATRADGLAIGGGKLWITQQTGSLNQISIFPFDLTTMTYGDAINITLPDGSNRATGATWAPGALTAVPEPSTFALLAVAAGTGLWLRRRRSADLR
ncbi:MAG TPA: PEP-CTERM sorting domain-containing protein [Chthoniobacterales bacterium]|nr:PEP-CTERM sorting domain-containing protein [Chthoniobacterales bacterium]